MRLVFTKGAAKTDRLEMIHADGQVEALDCPKQGIIPHDMVHYAVETGSRHAASSAGSRLAKRRC